MKVLWGLEPCPSVYDGLWGTRQLLSDDISQERMLLLRESRKGEGRAADTGFDVHQVARPEREHGHRPGLPFDAAHQLVAAMHAFSPDIVVVIMPSLVSARGGFKGDLPLMLCHEATCPVLLIHPTRLPIRRLAIAGPSLLVLETLTDALRAVARPAPLALALWVTLPPARIPARTATAHGKVTAKTPKEFNVRSIEQAEASVREVVGRLRRDGWLAQHEVLSDATPKTLAARTIQEDIDLLVPAPRLLSGLTGKLVKAPCSLLAVPVGGETRAQSESAAKS